MSQSDPEQSQQESTPKKKTLSSARGIYARVQKRISRFLSKPKAEISTGGGAYIKGSVDTGGGKFVGRDSISIGTITIETRYLAFALVAITLIVLAYLLFVLPISDRTVSPMEGDFNIAVAEFSRVDSSPSTFSRGDNLAEEVYRSLEAQLQPLQDAGIRIELRGPQEIGPVQGETPLQRAQNAEEIAQLHNADLVIYGVLRLQPNQTSLQPELYVNRLRLYKAEEAVGQYAFGLPITVGDRIDRNSVAGSELRQRLNERLVSLVHFSIGLGYLALIKYDDAAAYLEKARQQANSGKEAAVILLLQGTTAVKRHDLQSAADYYREALEVDNEYARAQLGLSQTDFLGARDDCQQDQVDAAGLAAAENGYQIALTMPDPPLADIELKARLMLANVYVCQSIAGIANRWQEAEDNLEQIVRRYEAAPEENYRIQYLAAEAENVLALSHASRSELTLAAESWDKALLLSQNPVRRAVFLAWQAWIHLQRTECELARADMDESENQYEEFKASNPAIEDNEYLRWFDQVGADWKDECVAAVEHSG